MPASFDETDSGLRQEGMALARHLVDAEAPADVLDRYVRAHAALPLQTRPGADGAVVRFARRHPWAIAFLDAGAAALDRDQLLRRKLLVMAGLLETTPTFAGVFAHSGGSAAATFLSLARHGLQSLGKLLVGAPLYVLVSRFKS